MATIREWLNRLSGALRPQRNDRDLEQELLLHLELDAEQARREPGAGRRAGQTAARTAAIRSGGLAQAMDAMRDQRGLPWLADLGQDLRHGGRVLATHPGFTLVAVLSLALGIGANTAIFTLINAVMLRTLPVREPQQLVELLTAYPGDPRMNGHGWSTYERLRDENHVFSDLVGVSPSPFQVSTDGAGDAETIHGEYVVGALFPALGIQPAIGRLIAPADDEPGSPGAAVAVISWSYWQSHFNGSPSILGTRLVVNRVPATIIGVTPRDFSGLQVGVSPAIWLPAGLEPVIQQPSRRADRSLMLNLIARLKPGVSIDQARADMGVLNRWRVEQMSARMHNDPQWLKARLDVEPAAAGFSALRDAFATPLLALMALVGVLLLLACVNIASLLLARGAARQREMAVRVSLGAGRFRLVRQVLTESLLLSTAGAALGVGLAYAGASALVRVITSGRALVRLPQQLQIPLAPDLHVLWFTAGVAMLTGVIFGLAPAWQAFGAAPLTSLREGGAAGESPTRQFFGKGLVVAQVALSVLLLSAAGLCAAHLSNLRNRDIGFERRSLLIVSTEAAGSGYNRNQLTQMYQELLARLEALPGVRTAALSGTTPIHGSAAARFGQVEGVEEAPAQRRYLNLNMVSPGYFETLGTPLIAGRDFEPADSSRPRVAIVNQAMARHYFSDGRALGQHITFDGDTMPYEIVGVAGDAKYTDLRQAPPRTVYLHTFQERNLGSQISLRTSVPPASVVAEVQRTAREILKTVRITKVTTMAEQVDASIVPERLVALLSGVFGALGALLAAIGLYGLLAYSVARRTHEIGIRMALGASSRNVTTIVLKSALGLVCTGLLVGTPLAFWAMRVATSLVEGVEADTTTPIGVAAAAMIAVGLLAAHVPVRRATHVSPTDALRHE